MLLTRIKSYFRYFFHRTPAGGVKSLEAELHLDNKVRQNLNKVNGQMNYKTNISRVGNNNVFYRWFHDVVT